MMDIMTVLALRCFDREIRRLQARLAVAEHLVDMNRCEAEIANYRALIVQYGGVDYEPPVDPLDTPALGMPPVHPVA